MALFQTLFLLFLLKKKDEFISKKEITTLKASSRLRTGLWIRLWLRPLFLHTFLCRWWFFFVRHLLFCCHCRFIKFIYIFNGLLVSFFLFCDIAQHQSIHVHAHLHTAERDLDDYCCFGHRLYLSLSIYLIHSWSVPKADAISRWFPKIWKE